MAGTITRGSFSLNAATGAWSLGGHVVSGATCVIPIAGRAYTPAEADGISVDERASQVILTAPFAQAGFRIKLYFEFAPGRPDSVVQWLEVENTGTAELSLEEIALFTLTDSLDLGSSPEARIIFEFRDSLEENAVCKVGDHGGEHRTSPFCLIHHPLTPRTFFAGALSFDRMICEFDSKFSPENGNLKMLSCIMRLGKFRLGPGKALVTETVEVTVSASTPFAVLEAWADQVNQLYRPTLPKKVTAGWLGWGWVDGWVTESPESIAARNVAAITRRLGGFGLDYAWISISNLKDCLPGNWRVPNDDFYPRGLSKTLDGIKAAGLQPGFWVGPFYIAESARDFDEVKPCLFRNEQGELSRRGTWLWAANAPEGKLPTLYALDPSHPGTIKYLRNVFAEYRRWGIRYFMLDFLEAGHTRKDDVPFNRDKVNSGEAYRECMAAIREAVGPESHLLAATGATTRHVGTVSSSRIGADYGEGRQLLPRFPSYPANYVINGSFGSAGSPNRNAVNNLACWYFAHDKFFLCNSNLMTVDKPIPLNEAQVSASLFGISGSPLMLGDDIDTIAEDRLNLIKKVLPRTRSAPIPVDLFTRLDIEDDFVRIFVVPVSKPWGEWTVCAVFNLNEAFRRVELDAGLLRLERGASYRMYDFWEDAYRGIFKDTRTAEVPANSCKVFRFEKVKAHPWILSTDMHVRQGEVELDTVAWDAEAMVLRGAAVRPLGETGNLYVVAPDGWKERHFNRGLNVAKSALDQALIIRKEITFDTEHKDWHIEFARL